MKVTLYGATGRAGSRILAELTARGHQVVAITRDLPSSTSTGLVTWKQDDLATVPGITAAIAGADAVVSAYAPPPDNTEALVGVCERLAEAVARTGVPRLLVVGGAGVLKVAPGVTLLDSGNLPPAWVPIARSHAHALATLRRTSIDWTYLSPAAFFDPGERTGKYRISDDTLLTDAQGQSRISMEDYASAMVDELEKPQHRHASFAVAW